MCARRLRCGVLLRRVSNVTRVSRNGGNDMAGRREPLSNAERQRRLRQRQKEQAAAAAEEARQAQLKPGARVLVGAVPAAAHAVILKHGIHSERTVAPRAEEILLRERAKPSWPAYLEEPVYERAIRAWARCEAMLELYTDVEASRPR
jgi:hypothetical protein